MTDKHEQLGDLIWRHWHEGTLIEDMPNALRPVGRAAGYAAQARLEDLSAHPRAGWKIAATSEAGQTHIGVDGPLAGRLFAETLHEDGAELSLSGNHMRVAEPEFAFRLGEPVPPQDESYSVEEVLKRVSDLHLTLELPDSRFAEFASAGGPALIADVACARELVVGPAVIADWRGLDLAAHRVHAEVGERYTRDGIGANVLGDPRAALTWCINEVTGMGITLATGELITTGTATVPLAIEAGDLVDADFGVLGKISVRITG